jgi:hypothetical protein
MKKIFTLSVLLCLSFSVFAQKDLELKLLSPLTGDEIYDDETFLLAYSIKNVGTEMIVPEDSFYVFMKMDGDYVMGGYYNLPVYHANIPVGDSVYKTSQFGFRTFGSALAPFSFCFELKTSINNVPIDTNLNNNQGCATIEVKTRTTGITNPNTANIKIYPNPAATAITVESNNHQASQAIITDITGRQVAIANLHTATTNIQVAALANGIYVCKLINSHGELFGMQKFVVSH